MSEEHYITREIGIDMGHRVTFHGSKCRNLHGHRYTIQATCVGPLFEEGEQQGMVLDFGFLKDEMMKEIDTPCDHGMTLWIDDPYTAKLVGAAATVEDNRTVIPHQEVEAHGYCSIQLLEDGTNTRGKYYIVPFVPTAENLAKHWFERLSEKVKERSEGKAHLDNIKVFETPNCSAQYPTAGSQ